MSRKSESSLVNHTLLNLYYKDEKKELEKIYPGVLALLSYQMIGVEEGLASLKTLCERNARVQLWNDDLARKHLDRAHIIDETGIDDWILDDIEAERKKSHYQFIYLPVLNFSLLSSIINYEDQHPFVRVVLWALFSGVPVGILSIGVNPSHRA